ncbi:MAG: hypothetical protein P8049_13230, partial [Gemmatimonadota bacterium]
MRSSEFLTVISGVRRADTLVARRMRLISDTHDIGLRGILVGEKEFKFFLDAKCDPGDTIFPYFNIDQYRAGIDLTGMWVGNFDDWDLRLSGLCRDFEYREARVPAGEIKLALEKRRKYHVYFDINADSCYI